MVVQQARARTRQQRILRAAATVIARRGYRAAAVDEIAREARTSKGGIYFHFAGKEAILLALLDHAAALLRRKVEAAIALEREPVACADAALRVLLQTLAKHRSLARVLTIEALAAGPQVAARVTAIQDEFAALIEEQLDLAVADGTIDPIDTRVVAQAWMGLLHGVITRWLTAPDRAPPDATYVTLRRLLLRSVGAALPAVPHPAAIRLDAS
ncbi:MAG: TetR/AcrR family transcriptional regulator [Dehalococcoidia bacterium]